MNNKNSLLGQLQAAIGGDWHITDSAAPLQGFSARFPRFQSDAIVGVINDAAERSGAVGRAVAFAVGGAGRFQDIDPNALQEVVLPASLAQNRAFAAQLTSEMKQVINGAMAHQLSRAAMQWLHAR